MAFKNETDYNVWASILTILLNLKKILEYTPYLHKFNKVFMRHKHSSSLFFVYYLWFQYQEQLLSNIRETTTWEPRSSESHTDGLLRALILNQLISIGDEKFVKEAINKFEQHVSKQMLLSADHRYVCFKVAIESQGRDGYEKLLECYKSTDLVEEKNRIIRAFGCTDSPELAKDVLEFYMSVCISFLQMCFFLKHLFSWFYKKKITKKLRS